MKPNLAFFRIFWYAVNLLLACSFATFLYGISWEASTRSYLRGFSDAVIPNSATPEQKVESILSWMARGPTRRIVDNPNELPLRDPEETLNYQQLLQVCGSATNAFVNLAKASELEVRRLLLLAPDGTVKHVVAEVQLDGRWVVVDPAYRVLFRDAQGQVLTKEQLRNPIVFREVTKIVPNYPQFYSYEATSQINLSRIPVIGKRLRPMLDRMLPGWEDQFDWTSILERESYAVVVIAGLGLLCSAGLRFLLGWYGDRHFGVWRIRLREGLRQAGAAWFALPK